MNEEMKTYIGAIALVVLLVVYTLAGLSLIGAFDVAVKKFVQDTIKQNECLSNLDKCHEGNEHAK